MLVTDDVVTVDWPRCQPRRGDVDHEQLRRLGADLERRATAGSPAPVVLCAGDAPAWLGPDFWLQIDSPDVFCDWVEIVVDAAGDTVTTWIPIARPNAFAVDRYVRGRGRRVRMATGFAIRCLDNLIAAHAMTRTLLAAHGHGTVRIVVDAFLEYELDRLALDLLLHRSRGIEPRALHDHLVDRREQWYDTLPAPSPRQRLVRHFTKSGIPLEQAFPRAQAAIAACGDRPIDTIDVTGLERLTPHDQAAYAAAAGITTSDVPQRVLNAP